VTATDLTEAAAGPPGPAPTAPPRRRWPFVVLGLALVVLVGVGAGAVWLERQLNPPGGPGPEVIVTIDQGATTTDIGHTLQHHGVITNATLFKLYVRLRGAGPFRAGVYTFRRHEHMARVVSLLSGGGHDPLERVTIPEGFTLAQVADRVGRLPGLSAARFLDVARSGAIRSRFEPPDVMNVEGLVYPDTYFISKRDDERSILQRMVQTFDLKAAALGLDQAAARAGITPYQAVIVASLVEREAKVDADRGMIARVIYNRLQAGMPLQIDATVQYVLGVNKVPLLDRDLQVDSPYNTYRVKGLPPGPIASPGRKSLQAALAPTPGPWLYYVLADASGRHAFATTPAEFDRLKAQAHAKGLL
jgi:UPF0755 protein